MEDDNYFNLTPRELDVMNELLTGKPNHTIAKKLRMEVATVKFHLGNIYEKLDVENRFEAYVKWNEYYG